MSDAIHELARKVLSRRLDIFMLCMIRKAASDTFTSLINFILYYAPFYLNQGIAIRFKIQWTPVKMTAGMIKHLKYLGQNKME